MSDLSTSISVRPTAQDALESGLRRRSASHGLSPTALKTLSAPRRRFIVGTALASGDFVAALVATSFSDLLVNRAAATDQASAALPAALLIAVYLSLGLYLGCGPSPCERFRLRALGVLAFVTMDLLIAAMNGLSVRVLAAAICSGAFVLLLGYYTEGVVRHLLIQWALWGATAVLVGCEARNGKLAERLMAEPQLGLRPVGFLSSPDDTDQRIDLLPLPLLGTMKDMARIGESVEVAIFASRAHLALDEVVCRGRLPFARVFVVEDAQDMQSLWLHTRTLGGAVGIEIRRDLYAPRNLWLKRAIDLLVAVPVGLLVLPLIAALALTIKAVDPGPAFYIQSRVGRDGRLLRILKVRTMYRDAERRLEDHLSQNPSARAEWQRYFKLTDDPRVLPAVGRFIRRASLDELPQLWNVVCGDMSLVGPRPFPLYHISSFDREFQMVRESVPPGLTGLWQISSRSDGDLEVQKAQDLFYIRNWSIWLDFYIVLQTVPAVISAKAAK
jgi:Undecaprenyl-phosphate galactose phosphotransferase WbaP